MLLLQPSEMEKLTRRKARSKRVKPLRSPVQAERDLQRRMGRLWRNVLEPAIERITIAIREGVSPTELSRMVEDVLRMAEVQYGFEADDVVFRWLLSVDDKVRGKIQQGLSGALGIDITAVLDTPHVKDALQLAGAEAASLIKTIPGEFLGEVARAVRDNFTGVGLPEGRSLMQQVEHLGGVNKKRARLIARDQTFKLTGSLNRVRQESIGVEEYIWRTVKDRRVVGNPSGVSPKGNKAHMNHYVREGKKFKWDSPPPDGHPGMAIQCRCWAEPVLDRKKILAHSQRG